MRGQRRSLWSLLCITLVFSYGSAQYKPNICLPIPPKTYNITCKHDCSTSTGTEQIRPPVSYKIKAFELLNCPSLLLPTHIFKNATKVTLKNIEDVTFNLRSNFDWSVGKREFTMDNCGVDTFNENVFKNGSSGSGSTFSKIEIINSNISRLDYHIFNNIEVDNFAITDSKINNIGEEAFDMKVKDYLTFSGNTVDEMHANSFFALKADPEISIAIQGNTMKKLLSQEFNLHFDSSMNNTKLSKAEFEENYINHDCGCDLFEAFNGSHKREALEKYIYGKLILSFECNHENRHYSWIDYDELKCKDEHGHGDEDHKDQEDKKKQRFFDNMGLIQYIVIGVGIFLVVVVPICVTVIVAKCFMKTKVRAMPMMPAVDDGSQQDEAWSFQMSSTVVAPTAASSLTRQPPFRTDSSPYSLKRNALENQESIYYNISENSLDYQYKSSMLPAMRL